VRILALLGAALLGGCAIGGGPDPERCEIRVIGIEEYRRHGDGLDVQYRVRGVAGSPGEVWLAARNPSGSWVPGHGVEVGPGPFEAIVDLKLSGEPQGFVALLAVAGDRRCKADAPLPGR
jgi:hypothetical protein